MRNIIISTVITALLVAGSVFFQNNVENLIKRSTENLDKCTTQEDISEFIDSWNQDAAITELMINHNEIDILNQHLWTMLITVDSDGQEFEMAKEQALEMLKHIAHRNELSVENIL